MSRRIVFPREVLLIEVERWCAVVTCNAFTRLALTKAEARAYTGFECPRCEHWNPDALAERDIPEWWEELKVASLEGLRPPRGAAAAGSEDAGEVVARLSDAWKRLGVEAEEDEGGGQAS